MPHYIEIDVEVGPNTDFPVIKVFQAIEEPWEVIHVEAPRPDGTLGPCAVTGWAAEGPVLSYAARVFDSGDGTALLIFGGESGIRLKPADSNEAWSTKSKDQWGEPCLLLPAETATNGPGNSEIT